MGQVTDYSAKVGVSSQNISITDMITEGPVRGLKNGKSSVFLNDIAAEDASYSAITPIQSGSTGTITFNGSSATSTATTGVTLDTNMILSTGDGRARDIIITNYKTQAVNLSNVSQDTSSQTSITLTATSGTPFTDIVWSSTVLTRKAALVADGHIINGTFFYTSSTQGIFNAGFTATDTIDTTKSWTLNVLHSFLIQSIDSSTQLTVQSNNIPVAGTYNFRVGEFRAISPRDLVSSPLNNFQKIDGLQIEANFGTLDQSPLTQIGGVGGAVAGTQAKSDELKVIGTGVISGIEPIKEVRNRIETTSIAGLPDDSQSDVANAAVEYADTAFGITASQRSEVDEIGFRITYPGGLQSMNNNKGKRETAYAWYVVQIATKVNGTFGDWQNAFPDEGQYVKHRGKTNASYSFDHVIHLDQYRPFEEFKLRIIRVTRHIGLSVTGNGHSNDRPDKDKWTLIAKSKVDQLNYVIKDKFRYPYTAMVQTSFNSKLYQQPPKMSYEMQGMLVRIPSNYTPREYSTTTDTSGNPKAEYSGLWNGTWKNDGQGFYTDNPAWVFMDIVTNNRYGAGKWIKEEDIDKYALYRIAQYCDELVDDGNGGVEPRFRANIFLTKATDVYKVLKDFASTFTGMLYWLDGNIVPVEDASTDPIYNFTKGNVIDGAFAYESTGRKTRPNQIVVSWNDPDQNYESVNLIVEDRQAILKDKKLIKENATAFGCTSEAQAIRYGRWKLWTAQKQTEIVSFKSALSSMYIRPGDVVNVQDADRYGVQYSGRVSSATSTTLTLDRNITLNSGSTYVLSTLVTSGDTTSIEENTITNSAGSTNTLTVSSFTSTPTANTIWALKETKDGLNVVGSKKQYKVLSITQEGPNTFGFSCVEHYNEKYGAIETGFATSVIPSSIYPEREPQELPAPSNLRAILETDAARPGEELRLEWDAPDSEFVAGYQILHTLEEYENPLITSDEHYRLENIPNGIYSFRVRAVSNRGNYSPYIGLDFEVDDPYADNVDRVQYGIPKGAISNSEAGITGAATAEAFTFAKTALVLASNGDKQTVVIPDENSQSIADITAEENYYIFLDADTPTLKLMYYDTESLENMPFWRDVGTGNSASSTSWTSIGSVSIAANSNRVTGSGFNTSVELRDILNLSGSTTPTTPAGAGAIVTGIISDTELVIDRTFDTAISSTTAYRANYRPDYAGDAVIARVRKDGSNVFSTERFLTVDPDFGPSSRSLIVNVDPIFLTYDIQGQQTNSPSSIDAEVYALGFTDPEFKMELPNRTDPVADNELDGTEVDFTAGETADLFKKDFILDTAGTVEYDASDLSAVFTVREKNNTDLTVSRTVAIPRRRDAASVFLELDNDNVTVFANTDDAAATVNFNCTATVSRGNNLFDIIAPDNVFVITTTPTSGVNGSLSGATYTVSSLDQGFTSGSVTFTATGVAGTEFAGVVLTKVMSISISATSGIDAEVYQINTSVGAISYNPNTTTFVPPTSTGITFSSQKFVGDNSPISFSGFWRIYLNGSSTATYSSSSAESSVNFTSYSATDTLITAKLFLETGATNLLDTETVPIVLSGEDGVDGADGVDARAVDLTAGTIVFTYAAGGTTPSPTSTTVTATAVNTSGNVYYEFFKNNSSVQGPSTGVGSNTYTYSPPANISSMPDQIEVEIREGSATNPILLLSEVSVRVLMVLMELMEETGSMRLLLSTITSLIQYL
jgi:predicted phage tail protein